MRQKNSPGELKLTLPCLFKLRSALKFAWQRTLPDFKQGFIIHFRFDS